MREWEITWVRRGQEPGEGTFIAQPDYCHHSRYVSGMVVRELEPNAETVAALEELDRGEGQVIDRCPFCASPLIPLDVHGHVSCSNCKQVLSTCCPGASDGQSG